MSLDLPALLGRIYYRYPSYLIDVVTEHESGNRLVAVKNVTVGEEFFQGHFPGSPIMPAVLTIEALTQLAAVLVLDRAKAPLTARASLRGVDSAKFRRSVVPGDRLRLEVALKRARTRLARVQTAAYIDEQVVAEAEILLAIELGAAAIHPTAHVDPAAQIGEGTIVGTFIGALIMAILANGLNTASVHELTQKIIVGCVLIAAAYIDSRRNRTSTAVVM